MDYNQLQQYQQSLLDRALSEGIRKNNENVETWTQYRDKHKSVIESLQIFPQDLTVQCMVPIGKRALMKGHLTHTNEILVSLGEGYFAKLSAAQAIALCNHRIKRADQMIEALTKESNLYEMRQMIPKNFDAFGDESRKEVLEHWDLEKLDDWRAQHRQRQKEYRKKLAELNKNEQPKIENEDDLLKRLDALELQEELEDELHRLEASSNFHTQELQDDEVYDESETDTCSESSDTAENETEETDNKIASSCSESSTNPTVTEAKTAMTNGVFHLRNNEETLKSSSKTNAHKSHVHKTTELEVREKTVAFGEPEVKYFNNTDKTSTISKDISSTRTNIIAENKSENEKDSDDKNTGEVDVIRIQFEHSNHEPEIVETDGELIKSPSDIYRMVSKPKSILKKSSNDIYTSVDNYSTEQTDISAAPVSAYNTIVKDIQEHVINSPITKGIEPVEQKRPISKFKRERASAN